MHRLEIWISIKKSVKEGITEGKIKFFIFISNWSNTWHFVQNSKRNGTFFIADGWINWMA